MSKQSEGRTHATYVINYLIVIILVGFLLGGCGAGGGSMATPTPVTSTGSAAGPSVSVVETTGDQALLLQAQPNVTFGALASSPFTITVNDATKYQQMDGYGGSITDSSAWLIANKLTSSQQATLMTDLFDPVNGIGLTWLRQPMGATDFALSNYTYDDMPSGQTDPTLANFSIAHDTAYIIPVIKQAMARNSNIKVHAVPWSPPAWMKDSTSLDGGTFNTAYFGALGNYFVKFIQEYQQNGVNIYAISPQNEPLNSTTSYPSESLPAADEANFIGNFLAPALTAASLTPKIIAYDHNWDQYTYPETVLGDAVAGPVTAGSAFHCYGGTETNQTVLHNAYPTKDIWFTECSGTSGSNWSNDLVWNSQHLTIGAVRNWAKSVSLWNIALDQNSGPTNNGCPNCRGIVTIDDSATPSTVTYNVEYYALGQASKFVQPGAFRIDSNDFESSNLYAVSFLNPDNTHILLVCNSASSSTTFEVAWNNQGFAYTLPAHSVATFKW